MLTMSGSRGYANLEEGGAHVMSLRVSFGGRTASNVVSEGALLQLVLCFLLSPARADPYVVGPLVALYALREDDRRALVLYGSISAASTPLDLGFLFGGGRRRRALEHLVHHRLDNLLHLRL